MNKSHTKPIDPKKLSESVRQIRAAGSGNDAGAMLYLGVHIVAAIDRNTRAINHMTAALRDEIRQRSRHNIGGRSRHDRDHMKREKPPAATEGFS